MEKRGQQEIAGFVIIVVLVVVAALIFMVLSFANKDVKNDSIEVSGLLSALLEQTTECIVSEPIPLNIGELISQAYAGARYCKDIDITTQDYLNKSLYDTLENVRKIDNRFGAWQIDIYSEGERDLPIARYFEGHCGSGEAGGAEEDIQGFSVELKICLNSYY
jgi:hypothetical protein